MPRALLLLAGALAVLLPRPLLAAKRPTTNHLLQVISPEAHGDAKAHPHVNVTIHFGVTEDGIAADPTTFRARLGGADITREFEDIVVDGQVIGKRAEVEKARLKIGRRRTNRMRFSVYGTSGGSRGRPLRDVDRIRFRVVEVPDTPPVAVISEGPRSFRVGVPVAFDGSQSYDPDGDDITYEWDFGDGQHATGPSATHVYTELIDPVVRLIVRDGGTNPDGSPIEGVAPKTLIAEPVLPDGTFPGTVHVGGDAQLELGVVGLGATATRSFWISNDDDRDAHLVIARVLSDVPAFTVAPPLVQLGPGEKTTVTVTFAPTGVGHQEANLTLAIASSNRESLGLLAHGFGGTGGGTGPTLAATPAFYTEFSAFGFAVRGILPDGTRVTVDNAVHACLATGSGFSSGDACVVDADCAANGGACVAAGICLGGDRDHQACTGVGDCPGGGCSSTTLMDAVDLCTDGVGGVYMLSDEGTFTDPNPGDNELTSTLLRIDVDAQGNTVGKQIIDRVTEDTTKLGCDGIAPGADGHVYLAEFHTDPNAPLNCIRSDREILTAVSKHSGGGDRVLLAQLDAATGLDDCKDDIDPSTHLEISRDARSVFASFETRGIWRVLPNASEFVLPETFTAGVVPTVFPADGFRLHPDGSLVVLATSGGKTGGVINVYRVSAAQVAGNPLPVSGLTPCQSVQLPTNAIPDQTTPFTSILSFALAPSAPGSRDATLLVGVAVGSQQLGEVLDPTLQGRATLAFALPADQTSCGYAGIVALEALDQLAM